MKEFSNCPRCNDSWNILSTAIKQCQHCGLYWNINYSQLCFDFNNNSFIYWILEDYFCMCYGNVFGLGLKLPYLPYDISFEKLKLYLNFL